jgi:hypothetical protein
LPIYLEQDWAVFMEKVSQKKFEYLVEKASEEAGSLLRSNGLDSLTNFQVKIKELKQDSWTALYRRGTEFMSRPIFWVNQDFQTIMIEVLNHDENTDQEAYEHDLFMNLVDTILHEIGHAIEDVILFKGRYLSKNEEAQRLVGNDIEDFAENMVSVLKDQRFKTEPYSDFFNQELKL